MEGYTFRQFIRGQDEIAGNVPVDLSGRNQVNRLGIKDDP